MTAAKKSEPDVGDVHVADAGGAGKKKRAKEKPVKKEDPRGMFIKRDVMSHSATAIHEWTRLIGFKNLLKPTDLHVTQIWSEVAVEPLDLQTEEVECYGPYEVARLGDLGAIVLRFESPELSARFRELVEKGATPSFPDYKAHVTIAYDPEFPEDELKALNKNYRIWWGRLTLGPERRQPIDPDWANKLEFAKGERATALDPKERAFVLRKVDEEQRLVFGFFTIPEVQGELVLDKEGDALDPADLEKAAYEFNLNARVAGERHTRMNVGRLVESAVLTVEKQQAMQKMLVDLGIKDAVIDLKCSAWWGGFKVDDDEVWAKVQKGDYPAFSIGGSATREDVTKGDRDVPRGMGSMIASGENADVLIAF